MEIQLVRPGIRPESRAQRAVPIIGRGDIVSNDNASNDATNMINPQGEVTSGRPDQTPHGRDGDADRSVDRCAAERADARPRQSLMAEWLGNSAADLLGPGLVLSTQDQGYSAALNGDHLDACPWRFAETDRDRALRQMWIRGYCAGRTDLRIARDPDRPTP